MTKATKDLKKGDRVQLPGGRIRTVARVATSGYKNFRNESILYVYYAEGAVDGWSEGNSSNASGMWEMAA